MGELKKNSGRVTFLDVARSFAIISITFNHAVGRSFNVYYDQYNEYLTIPLYATILKAIFYAFSRIGVPVFLMISGALLLPRDYSNGGASRFLKNNWLKLFITTEVWLALMFWYNQGSAYSVLHTQGAGACLLRFVLNQLFINPQEFACMWYMEMILCVYLLIPILSVALKKLDHKYFLLPLALVAFCSLIVPDINGILGSFGIEFEVATKLESANIFSKFIIALLTGYFISYEKVLEKVKSSVLVLGTIASFVAFCGFQFYFYAVPYDFAVATSYASAFPFITGALLFELFRRRDYSKFFTSVTMRLSEISFGIYFVHIFIMEILNSVLSYYTDIRYLPKFFLLEAISFLGAALIVAVTKKVRIIGQVFYGIRA